MARSLVAVAVAVAASLSERTVLFAVNRRGYAAAAAAAAGKSSERKVVADSSSGGGAASASANCWVPDPETGFYRPGNLRTQVDAAELREMLLSQNP